MVTRIAELFAQKGTELSGAAIDAYCVGITHEPHGVVTVASSGNTKQCTVALKGRNPRITEVADRSSPRAKSFIREIKSEWWVKVQVTNPVQAKGVAGARSEGSLPEAQTCLPVD